MPRSVWRYWRSKVERISIERGEEEGGPTLGVQSLPERVLLSVASSEDPVAEELHGEDSERADGSEIVGVHREVVGGVAVGEGDPGEVSDGEHESKAVRGDVHSAEDSGLRDIVVVSTATSKREELRPTSFHSASITYQAWNATTRYMLSVMRPILLYCAPARHKSMRTQRMSPGLISLKALISNDPRRGLRERPMNHCIINILSVRSGVAEVLERTLKKSLSVFPPRASISPSWKLCTYTKMAYTYLISSISSVS